MIKFFDKLYVVKRTRDVIERFRDDPDLAFMCQYEENAAFEKRKGTMYHWASKSYRDDIVVPYQIIDNIPVAGFSITGFVGRHTTDNKLLRIKDPRGFILEISIANFFEICETANISNGVIQEPLVWGRDGANNYLVHKDHPDYLKRNKNYVPKEGEYFCKDNTQYRYLGKYYAHTIAEVRSYPSNASWYSYRDSIVTYEDEGLDNKVFHLYEREPYSWQKDKGAELVARRSVFKDCEEPDNDLKWEPVNLEDWNEYRFDSTKASGWHRRAKFYKNKNTEIEKLSSEQVREILTNV